MDPGADTGALAAGTGAADDDADPHAATLRNAGSARARCGGDAREGPSWTTTCWGRRRRPPSAWTPSATWRTAADGSPGQPPGGDPAGGRRGGARRPGRASTSSASGSTTGPTSRSARPTWCWPRSPGQTERIRLGTSVTVLSSDDPIRVFQRFSTLDAVSGGRAEVTLGRGSFTESFPLFGLSLDDYEVLFSEKLEIFTELLEEEPVTWEGTTRPPLAGIQAFPRTAARAARLGRGRRYAGVGGPRGVVRPAAGARRHRRLARSGSRRWSTSTTAALEYYEHGDPADLDAQPRPRRRHRRAGPRADVPPPGRRVHQDRQGARLGPVHARAVRGRRRPDRLAVRRLARDGGRRRSPGRCGRWGCRGSS